MTVSNHPNCILARRLWDAIAASDDFELERLIATKSVWRMYGESPIAGVYNGLQAIIGLLARVGEMTDELESNLIDVFASDSGAVIRYSIHARRGARTLDIDHLFLIRVFEGQIVEGIFAPLDQERYDAFWRDLPEAS